MTDLRTNGIFVYIVNYNSRNDDHCFASYFIIINVIINCFILYCIVLYCIVLYCIVLYCIVLYCVVFSSFCIFLFRPSYLLYLILPLFTTLLSLLPLPLSAASFLNIFPYPFFFFLPFYISILFF